MTSDDTFVGQLEGYLDRFDGETPLPERVRAEVRAAIPAIRQVSARRAPLAWWGSVGRLSAAARFGFAAMGVVLAVAIGTALVAGNRDRGVAATPGVQTPVPTPSAAAAFPISAPFLRSAPSGPCVAGGSGTACIEPGTYRLDPDVVPVSAAIDVPRGWFEWDLGVGSAGLLVDRSDIPSGSGWGILFSAFGRISADPCNPKAGFVPSVDTAAKVVQAMQGWPGFRVGAPQPISIGGNDGFLVEMTSTKNASVCPSAVTWETSSGTAVDGYPMVTQSATRPAQFRILDTGDRVLVIRTTDFPQQSPFEETQSIPPDPTRHADDQLALRAIVASLRFAPNP
jgi:hypothetical protein